MMEPCNGLCSTMHASCGALTINWFTCSSVAILSLSERRNNWISDTTSNKRYTSSREDV